jgi:hypothetical protein
VIVAAHKNARDAVGVAVWSPCSGSALFSVAASVPLSLLVGDWDRMCMLCGGSAARREQAGICFAVGERWFVALIERMEISGFAWNSLELGVRR